MPSQPVQQTVPSCPAEGPQPQPSPHVVAITRLVDKHADERQRQAAELVVTDELVEVEGQQLKRETQVVAEQEEVLAHGARRVSGQALASRQRCMLPCS